MIEFTDFCQDCICSVCESNPRVNHDSLYCNPCAGCEKTVTKHCGDFEEKREVKWKD